MPQFHTIKPVFVSCERIIQCLGRAYSGYPVRRVFPVPSISTGQIEEEKKETEHNVHTITRG